jgi:chemotaxis protein CheD
MTNTLSPPNHRTAASPRKNSVVGMGDMATCNDTSAQLITYSLGSCVGVTIYDPVARVGGMLHAMLPDSSISAERAASRPHMFVDTGLPAVFHAVYALGGVKHRIVVKLAGGAEFLDAKKIFNIGDRNVQAVVIMLARNGVNLEATQTGGHESRTMRLDLATGAVTLDIPGRKILNL